MLTTDETFEEWLRRCKVRDALTREHMLTPAEALAVYDALVEVGAFGWRA